MDAKTKAAQALDPLLAVFKLLDDQVLQIVWQRQEDNIVDRFILEFESVSLIITANASDDTINFEAHYYSVDKPHYIDVSNLHPWSKFIGKKFGWGWVTINQQGYCDGLLLSFGSIIPDIVLNVSASEVTVGLIEMSFVS
jgi:hypothetical protein